MAHTAVSMEGVGPVETAMQCRSGREQYECEDNSMPIPEETEVAADGGSLDSRPFHAQSMPTIQEAVACAMMPVVVAKAEEEAISAGAERDQGPICSAGSHQQGTIRSIGWLGHEQQESARSMEADSICIGESGELVTEPMPKRDDGKRDRNKMSSTIQ